MLLNIVLFIIFFGFYCCLIPLKSTAAEDSFDSFIPEIKRAFSSEFNPEPEVIKQPVTKEVLTLPSTSPNASNFPTISDSSTYRELQQFVKFHNLQQTIKQITGKPYNKCKKVELLEALKA